MAIGSMLGLGVSALGGLLGGRRRGGGAAFGQAQGALRGMDEQRRLLTNLSQQGLGQYNQYAPQAQQAMQSYAGYLGQDPYTDAYSQAALTQATQGLTGGYLSAKANLAADLARRGIQSGSTPPAELAGGLSGIESARAGVMGQAQMGLGMQKIDDRERRMAMLLELLSGGRDAGLRQALGGAQGAAGIGAQQFQGYMGLGGQQEQMAQAADDRLGGLFGILGQLYDQTQNRRRR